LLAPSPRLKDKPASGLDCSGISKPRRISVKTGRQQVPLCTVDAAKGQGSGNWQGRQGSNLRQPVLETGTLPTELHPCGNQASPLISAVSSIGKGQIARAKRLTPCSTQLFCVKLGQTRRYRSGQQQEQEGEKQ